MLVSTLGPKQKTLFGAASPRCGLAGGERHDAWKGSLRNKHTIMALLWDPPSSCLDRTRRLPAPAASISRSGGRSMAPSIGHGLPRKQRRGSPSTPHSPPREAMANGGEPRPQTQSHRPEGLRYKFREALKIKFGRQMGPTCPPLRARRCRGGGAAPRASPSASACAEKGAAGRGERGKREHPLLSKVWDYAPVCQQLRVSVAPRLHQCLL